MPKNANIYCCEKCDFKCSKLSNYNIHCSTRKHIKRTKSDGILIFETKKNAYQCLICNKQYQSRNGLWLHKKNCKKEEKQNNIEEIVKEMLIPLEEKLLAQNKTQPNEISLVPEIIKQSQEFQQQMFQQMIEFMKQQSTTTNNIVNGNINNNNQFNLQIYLNETCKNAMNIDQFIEYLQPTLQELEDTARLGYVEGITRIIMRGLKDLEENERPFHCSDLKRETMFVKNNNDIWEKEPDEKPQLMKVVKAISRKNFCNVNAWQKEHPTWRNHDSKQNDQYNKILVNSTSGSTEEEQKNSYEKIIKNIVKETVIDKSRKNK